MDTIASEPTTSWLIQFAIAAIGAAALVLAKFVQGLRSPAKPEHKILTAEIADTTAVAAKIVADLGPPIKAMMERGDKRDEKIDRILTIIERMQIRDEEREKAEEREARRRPAGPAE